MNTLTGKDVFLRVTDNHNGRSTVRQHRVWDVDRFIESQRKAHREEGERVAGGETPDPMRFTVSLATADEYRAANRRTE